MSSHVGIWGASRPAALTAVSRTNRASPELRAVRHPTPGCGSQNALILINRKSVGWPHQRRLCNSTPSPHAPGEKLWKGHTQSQEQFLPKSKSASKWLLGA